MPILVRLLAVLSASVMSALLLCACNGFVSPVIGDLEAPGYFPIWSSWPAPWLFGGSAVQWNEEYAVTAKHIHFIKDEVYSCSTGCDLAFIKHKATGPLPLWHTFKPGESVRSVGYSPYMVTVEGHGKAYPNPFQSSTEKNGELYGITDAQMIKGMSGGPVYGADGAVLGINIGWLSTWLNPQASKAIDSDRITVFVPTAVIQREWNTFHSTLTVK